MDDAYYRDLAERLAAAAISHGLGNRSVDYTLKHEIRSRDTPIGEYWMELARKVSRDIMEPRR